MFSTRAASRALYAVTSHSFKPARGSAYRAISPLSSRGFSISKPIFQHIETVPHAGVYAQIPAVCKSLLEAKARSGLTFEDLAHAMGRSEVWVASVFFGQAKPEVKDIEKMCKTLGIDSATVTDVLGEGFFPQRGLGPMPPVDPLLYRLYEIVLVYGQPLKAVIHEKFGDGIVSAIDFTADVQRQKHEKGDRVVITLNGKFLPHTKF